MFFLYIYRLFKIDCLLHSDVLKLTFGVGVFRIYILFFWNCTRFCCQNIFLHAHVNVNCCPHVISTTLIVFYLFNYSFHSALF
ncbi:unnamed protein product [Phytomonas sp. Hart1]|nr:unnamed protein product [Phytomonas sp. Hart1]|eukprot:CCW69645.1 unnamed protein product [Phytomonas sp. isolate Hart1]